MEARKIEFVGTNLESAVYQLLAYKARGESVYGEFNGHRLYSDTVTMDSAYIEVVGCTKEEHDRRLAAWREDYDRREREREAREAGYKNRVAQTRANGEPVVITMGAVIAGLKFIAENPSISQEDLISGLLELGCNFTLEDINRQFPEPGLLFPGMAKGNIACGASVICNVRDSEYGRAFADDRFLSIDDGTSIYHFIRFVTGDDTYTKANIEKKIGTGGPKF